MGSYTSCVSDLVANPCSTHGEHPKLCVWRQFVKRTWFEKKSVAEWRNWTDQIFSIEVLLVRFW